MPPASDAVVSPSAFTHSSSSLKADVDMVANEQRTYIARLIVRMEECLGHFGVNVHTDESVVRQIESMSILIHESMSISSRNYHSVQHVFDISRDLEDPIAILAALFHDCVYYHVDGGLSELQAKKLHGVLLIEESQDEKKTTTLKINPNTPTTDSLLRMVMSVYSFPPGHAVTPMTGLNEFLSAVIAVRELEPVLPVPILAQIACCIEATIPFRGLKDGKTVSEQLFNNMVQTNQSFSLGLTEPELVQSVQRAALVSNEDVGNFSTEDRAWFLDNTWSLLPESNEALRHQYLYTVKEFQFAVFKMNGFFGFLKPTVIFQQFRGVPEDAEVETRTRNAARNLEVGRKYVGAKLLSISVLAAFAELTGGDAPISLFMGDLPSRHRVSSRLADSLPHPAEDTLGHCDLDVYNLLAHGRGRETAFDVRQSPLAAYFYSIMGCDRVQEVLKEVKVYPMTEQTARELLERLPLAPLKLVAESMAKLALSRKRRIQAVIDQLEVAAEAGDS